MSAFFYFICECVCDMHMHICVCVCGGGQSNWCCECARGLLRPNDTAVYVQCVAVLSCGGVGNNQSGLQREL